MKISVVVTIYNTNLLLLDNCINSILNQDFNDFELLLINDGSEKYIDVYIKNKIKSILNITYKTIKNSGPSIARNVGLKMASGNYVYFMDHDDMLADDFLDTIYTCAERNLSDITLISWYKNESIENIGALATCGALYNRQFLIKNNLLFPIRIQPCEDGIFSHEALALTDKISISSNSIYIYIAHEKQNSKNIDYSSIPQKINRWFNILEQFYHTHTIKKDKKYLLARFVENEPFHLRLMDSRCPYNEKKKIFYIIKSFMSKNGISTKIKKSKFSNDFYLFSCVNNFYLFVITVKIIYFLTNIKNIIKIFIVYIKNMVKLCLNI